MHQHIEKNRYIYKKAKKRINRYGDLLLIFFYMLISFQVISFCLNNDFIELLKSLPVFLLIGAIITFE